MTPTDFDGAWKEALELYFRPFLEFCFPDIAARVDWSKGFEFLDKELEKIVHDAAMGDLSVDKLVKVYRLDGKEGWLLIHVEVQSQTDYDLPRRMYHYFHRIADRYGKAVVSMAVLADEHPSWRPNVFEEANWGCSIRFEYLICKLLDHNKIHGALEASLNPIATVVAAHLAAQVTRDKLANRFNLKWRLTRKLHEKGYTKQEVRNLYRLIDWVLIMPKKMDLAFEKKVIAYEEKNRMPFITSIERIGIEKGLKKGRQEGHQEGRNEGRQEGRQEGQTILIVRMLKRRWGTLAPELENRLSKLSMAQLENLGEMLWDFKNPTSLQQWLDSDANRGN